MFAEAEDFETAAERFDVRLRAFKRRRKPFPRTRHFAYWLLHNCVAHPLLGVAPCKATVQFHTSTSDWLNLRRGSPAPAVPKVPKIGWWLLHNLVAHVAIGFFPVKAAFRFHDWTAERMGVAGWV